MPILSESGVVTQGVTLGGSSSQYAIVDVSIPSGNTVMGSGVLLLQVYDDVTSSMKPISSVPAWYQDGRNDFRWTSGPHPTDASKWRFTVTAARASVTMPEQDLQVWLTYVSTV
jgi:hypothetical protein